jgi:hypothetical protein
MKEEFLEHLVQLAPAENRERLDLAAHELDALVTRLTAVLESLGDARLRQDMIAHFGARALALLNQPQEKLEPTRPTPELLDWARHQFSEEEIVAGLREVRTTGGLELQDFIREIEQEAMPRE